MRRRVKPEELGLGNNRVNSHVGSCHYKFFEVAINLCHANGPSSPISIYVFFSRNKKKLTNSMCGTSKMNLNLW